MSEKEFQNWQQYFAVLFDTRTPLRLRKSIITLAPDKFVSSISEIILNAQKFNIPLNEQLKNHITTKFRKLLRSVLATKSLSKKRKFLKSKRGLIFISTILPQIINRITDNGS